MKTIYSTVATVKNGRMGSATVNDSDLVINMVPPSTDEDADGNNPEQLFAMGYGACFDSALGVVKKQKDAKFDSTTEVEVELLAGGMHDYNLGVRIHVIVENTDLSADEIQALVEEAHKVCPYSKAVKGNIDVEVGSEVK
ncbi:Ohr family peroxiredoxin [Psychrobacter sp. FDAARGOS_221]|uniref:Ohr family peroxiredoxin n=1 Tax=Psychrobacter sp. FDAARGOS_221 TaxID=1975705 RepID=UPI000BB58726|nr:Ohr family peroxiredoxin [Psychrobacter sp. FDAARGOS_221]PNK61113.1 osmotically inducible protein OsmC [Psychrobacter sp. FDAARGOS_221]